MANALKKRGNCGFVIVDVIKVHVGILHDLILIKKKNLNPSTHSPSIQITQ